ncbi:hypothetical protein HII36_40785 [Nonomuraea sp. NN258]|uniref:hypothetical protein n=1 Tax=Nonomuraea antri TaxID=2730852 RepID=UPI00156A5639|nr:hypothetical protein [Nonomuraea antri]NRQ38123.1 hypothetical protein [Nonomuraea antri]
MVLVPAIALRGLAMLGYRPALFFWADSFSYLRAAADPVPGTFRPLGYSLFLAALSPGHSLALVTFAQHALGLGLAVAAYALLRRRGLPGWGAAAMVTPLLYDEFLILLEHLIMADTLFTVLVTGGIMVLLGRVTPVTAACGGTLLALAALTRTVGLVVLVLAAGHLLLRRAGWRPLAALALAATIPLAGYASWMAATSGTFGLTRADGLFLWSRTMTFADCAKIRPEPRLAPLCPDVPVAGRPAPPYWLWQPSSPLRELRGDVNERAGRFARAAIAAQPGDYLAAVGSDLRGLWRWERTTARSAAMKKTNPYWFPFEEQPLGDRAAAESYEGGPAATRIAEPFAGWLRAYQRVGYLPFPLLVTSLAGTLAAAVIRRMPDALLPGLAAAALILAPPFTNGFDVRYVVPAIPLACLAAGLVLAGRSSPAGPLRLGDGGPALHPARLDRRRHRLRQ